MKQLYTISIFSLAMMTFACIPRSGADMILYNGVIITADKYLHPSEAVAIVDGKILAVGKETDIMPLGTWSTKKINLHGATVVPGLTDAHFHLVGFGASLDRLQLMDTGSPEQIAQIVAHKAGELPPGTWIQGRGWDQNDWEVKQFPHHSVLDTVSPDHPVVLSRVDGHAIWVNSAALKLAGITADTQAPDGGAIIRDDSGEPTGVLVDNAQDLITSVLPASSDDDIRRWLLAAMKRLNEVGLTEVHDAGVSDQTIRIIKQLIDEGLFTIRYYGMLNGSNEQLLNKYFAQGPILNYGNQMTVRTVKLYADGALGSRGAALLSDYSDDPGNTGLLITPPKELERLISKTLAAGFQPAVHAIGDRANRLVLNMYERQLARHDGEDHRPRIEHAQILARRDIRRFAKLGIIASMQPTHATSDMVWAEDRLGSRRIKGAYAWKQLLREGVKLAGGSDCPVEREEPLMQIYAARTRQDDKGWPEGGWRPDDRMTGSQALRNITAWAAHAAFEDSLRGKIFPGFDADMTILSKSPVSCEPEEILGIDVLTTFIGGKVVFKNDAAWSALKKLND